MIVNRKIFIDFIHLFVLVAFAVAQPIYDMLGKYPEFFVAHKASPLLIISLIAILTIGLAFVLVLTEVVSLLFGKRVRNGLHLIFVFSLTLLVILPFARQMIRAFDLMIVAIAIIIALLFTLLYYRRQPVQMFMTLLSPVVLIFPLWFLWSTPVGSFVLPENASTHAAAGQDSAPVIEIKNPAPVIVVVFDEFSTTALLDAEKRIDAIRYPNFAALTSESLWFPNAIGATVDTVLALPAIMTGKQPNYKAKLTPTADDHPNSIFSLLGTQYELNVFELDTAVCPDKLCPKEYNLPATRRYASFFADIAVIYLHVIAPPNLRLQLPTLDGHWTGFGLGFLKSATTKSEDVVNLKYSFDQFQKNKHIEYFLSKIKNNDRPALHFIHALLPHIPYWYLSSGHQYSEDRKLPDGIISDKVGWVGEDSLILTAYHQYLHQVGYVDRFLGNLVSKLRAEGLYEKALIIITADHGLSFQSGKSRRLPTEDTAKEIIKVPMIIKLPEQREGKIDERLVSGIDVLPTVIDVLEVGVKWEMDGISMVSNDKMTRKGIDIPLVGHFTAEELKGFSRLEWQIDYFGIHSSLDELIPKGPYEVLRHKKIDSLHIGEAASQRFISDDIVFFQNVDMQSDFLPAQFRGYVTGSDEHNLTLAIALNGQIWATTKTSAWNGKHNYFSVLLPPAAFKDSWNLIDVYIVEKKENALLLLPLIRQEGHYKVRLKRMQTGRVSLIFIDEREVPVDTSRNNMDGYLDRLTLKENALVFEGWAADLVESQPASDILFFKGNKLVWQVAPTYRRDGVAKAFNRPELLHSGYRAIVPLSVLESHSGDISVISISKDKRAFRIHIKENQKELIRTTFTK